MSLYLQRRRGCEFGCESACASALREALRRKTLRGIRRGQCGSMSCRTLHLTITIIVAQKTWTARHDHKTHWALCQPNLVFGLYKRWHAVTDAAAARLASHCSDPA